jgi:hypothetical protein
MSGRDKEKRSEIPHELRGKVAAFDSSLNNVENEFEPLLKLSQIELNAKVIRSNFILNTVKNSLILFCIF